MNQAEASQLLTIAATLDNRAVTAEAVQVWAGLLDDIDYTDAVAALKAHYRTSDKWMMPAHVRDLVTAARRDARRATGREIVARRDMLTELGIDYVKFEAGEPEAIEAARIAGIVVGEVTK